MPITTLETWMILALEQAQAAHDLDEVPVGALLIHSTTKEIITAQHNLVEARKNPTAHAEILCIEAACEKLATKNLQDYTLFVTLEPCPMCASAMAWAKLGKLVFGAYDPKSGGVDHGARVFSHPTCHHKPTIIGGIMEQQAGNMMRHFFESKRHS